MDMHASKTLCTGLYKSRCINSYYSGEDFSPALEKKKKLIRVVLQRVKPCVVLLFMAGTIKYIFTSNSPSQKWKQNNKLFKRTYQELIKL
jgi:hypothetical protein